MPTPSASEPLTIDPALVARFRGDLTVAAGRAIADDERLAVAVSGGPDSIALLALAHAAYPGRVAAATYDHRARTGSAAEAETVGTTCRALGVPHAVLIAAAEVGPFRHAAARADRYAALGEWATEVGAALLLTAHHADDQAETLLMRLNRGSGIAGLAGVRAKRPTLPPFGSSEVEKRGPGETFLVVARNEREALGLLVVRPLLDWHRVELRELALGSSLPFHDDPSNADPRFERARVRQFLAQQELLDPARLARSAAHLREAEADLSAITDWLLTARQVAAPAGQVWLDLGELPRELQRRLVRSALGTVAGAPFDPATNVEALLDALRAGRAATQAEVLVRPRDTVWRFSPAPPRRSR